MEKAKTRRGHISRILVSKGKGQRIFPKANGEQMPNAIVRSRKMTILSHCSSKTSGTLMPRELYIHSSLLRIFFPHVAI